MTSVRDNGWLTGRGEGSGLLISDVDVVFGRPLNSFFSIDESVDCLTLMSERMYCQIDLK